MFPIPHDGFGVVKPTAAPGNKVVDVIQFAPIVLVGMPAETKINPILLQQRNQGPTQGGVAVNPAFTVGRDMDAEESKPRLLGRLGRQLELQPAIGDLVLIKVIEANEEAIGVGKAKGSMPGG